MRRVFQFVHRGDMLVCGYVVNSWQNRGMDLFFGLATRLADPLMIMAFPVFLLLYGGDFLRFGLIMFLCLLINFSLTTALKGVWARPRPKKILMNLDSRRGFFNEYAFPSGHTSAAFTVATFYSFAFPGFTGLWMLGAILVGLSRIYLQEHYPSDVIVGALIGSSLTSLIIYLM